MPAPVINISAVHIHVSSCGGCDVAKSLETIFERMGIMSAALDHLTQEVSETKTAVDFVLTLVAGLADQIRALKDDPAKLEELASELDAQQARLAQAVTDNTPPVPPPDAPPAPPEGAPTDAPV